MPEQPQDGARVQSAAGDALPDLTAVPLAEIAGRLQPGSALANLVDRIVNADGLAAARFNSAL